MTNFKKGDKIRSKPIPSNPCIINNDKVFTVSFVRWNGLVELVELPGWFVNPEDIYLVKEYNPSCAERLVKALAGLAVLAYKRIVK